MITLWIDLNLRALKINLSTKAETSRFYGALAELKHASLLANKIMKLNRTVVTVSYDTYFASTSVNARCKRYSFLAFPVQNESTCARNRAEVGIPFLQVKKWQNMHAILSSLS